jgi:hypothetical protein
MPRPSARCPQRSKLELDLLDELNCVYWTPLLRGIEFKTLDNMRDCWRRHGGKILPHYIRQRPGTRPFALWALGELPLPPMKNKPVEYSLSVTISRKKFYSAWHYFGTESGEDGYYHGGTTWGEFTYLRKLGVIDDAEARLAKEWVDDRHDVLNRPYRDYKTLATD